MDAIALLFLITFAGGIALVVWLVRRAVIAQRRIEEISQQVSRVEFELQALKLSTQTAPSPMPKALFAEKAPPSSPSWEPQPEPVPVPPRIPLRRPAIERLPIMAKAPIETDAPAETADRVPLPFAPPEVSPAQLPKINWEQFLGVKGFAWLGGFALFLGIVFFIKYSFDNNLIPPGIRMAIGFVAGLGLLVGGGVLARRNFPALAQTLCATGVVVLYAVTFACRSIYHFPMFSPVVSFFLMILITATAFVVAIRLDAMVVAILGMLGGFLTPVLLSTGQDNPWGLFGYIAMLDGGLVLVALNRRWYFLAALTAAGTVVMQIGWAAHFFVTGKYFEGNKIFVALMILLGFNLIYLSANWLARRRGQTNPWFAISNLGLVAVAFVFAGWFQDFVPLAQRPWLIFAFVFVIDAVAIVISRLDETVSVAESLAGFAAFGLLARWTAQSLSNDRLNAALVYYFVFAIVHSLLPVWRARRNPTAPVKQVLHIFPILALLLVLLPIFRFAEVSFVIWPFILLVDLLAIVLAVLTSTLLSVLAAMILTLGATGILVFKIPADASGLPGTFCILLAAFVIFFVMAGIWLVEKFKPQALQEGFRFGNDLTSAGDLAAILPGCSIILPFLLLIMATARLPLLSPSPVFGLAMLLVVLLLGVSRLFYLEWLPAIGLACVAALEYTWHFRWFDPASTTVLPGTIVIWYLSFYVLFTIFPFLFLKKLCRQTIPWAAAALAGPAQFLLFHRLLTAAYPNSVMGLLPTAFAIPPLISLMVILKSVSVENPARLTQLAWFGGATLFFITLIFPIQFNHQWITLGWALEGVALLWLFHRVPHPGLRLVGVGLLYLAFVRLALNPAVLDYHPRSTVPIFNWYLYTYGIATACMFGAAKLLAPPRHLVTQTNVPPILASLGTVLAFLLLNIEIADYFSSPGSTLTFDFTGNFARDMGYSIAWALFALGLLVYGIAKKSAPGRYAGMGLLGATLLKLFFHDLAQLSQLYRIGAFIGVACIAMVASFIYQKFYTGMAANPDKSKTTP